MSLESAVRFLAAARDDPGFLTRYQQRNHAQLLFHAKNDGFDFSAWDLSEVASRIEASIILTKDHDPYDGTARLWRQMWGQYHLEYIVEQLGRHSEEDLTALISTHEAATRNAVEGATA